MKVGFNDMKLEQTLKILEQTFSLYGDDFNWFIPKKPSYFTTELERELCREHVLYGIKAQALAKCESNDDVLFALEPNQYAIVHLTYSIEKTPNFPKVVLLKNIECVLEYLITQYQQDFK